MGSLLDLCMGVDAVQPLGIELHGQAVGQVGVGARFDLCPFVVGLEGVEDVLALVHEVEDVHLVLARPCPVQAGERLDSHHSVEALVHVHGAQQRLVEADLVLVGHDHHLVGRAVENLIEGLALGAGVHAGLGVLALAQQIVRRDVGVLPGDDHLAGERHESVHVVVAVLGGVALDGLVVAQGVLA